MLFFHRGDGAGAENARGVEKRERGRGKKKKEYRVERVPADIFDADIAAFFFVPSFTFSLPLSLTFDKNELDLLAFATDEAADWYSSLVDLERLTT